jgi:DNA-binding PadR family transcriptional regulator
MPDSASQVLPLNPRTFMILLAFAEGPAHGYEIKRRAEERSEGRVQLDAGSLYRSVAHLMDQGLIDEVAEDPEAPQSDSRRRYYALTEAGREALAAEAHRLAGLVEYARIHNLIENPEGAR